MTTKLEVKFTITYLKDVWVIIYAHDARAHSTGTHGTARHAMMKTYV